MTTQTVAEFIAKSAPNNRTDAFFELENPYTLEINLNGNFAWTKLGSMVAYKGDVKFEREGALDRGIGGLLKKAVTGEGVDFTKAVGSGKVYVSDYGKKILILKLNNESVIVNGNDVLAIEPTIDYDIQLLKLTGMSAGGMTNVHLSGTGYIAITTHYDPLVLVVEPNQPVFTDPNATVAWSGNLSPQAHVDASLRTLMGRGSGETFQLKFMGQQGFVVVQPYEEHYSTTTG
jgi:uncharacterized protein (AIM24 family)